MTPFARIVCVVVAAALGIAAGAAAQEEPVVAGAPPESAAKPPAESQASAPTPSESQPPAPKRGPKYLNLRYDEDFSYLDGEPGSFVADPFDPIKNIHLDENWRLSLGGEFRFRLESETNKGFGATEPAQDAFQLYRFLVHADFKYRDVFRVFVQGAYMFDEDRDLAPRGIDENDGDLHQLFFDWRMLGADRPLTLRVGRQELQYGNQRLVSPFEWGNIRRRFDGVKLFARGSRWDVDLWYAKPVVVQGDQRDRFDEDVDFYGAYATYKGIERHGLDLYLLVLDDRGNAINPNGRRGNRGIYTVGTRLWGTTGGFDYETELASQWGKWAGDNVEAWSWTIDGGYTVDALACKPRIGVGFDWAGGDDNPFDGSVGTFNQLFPLGHAYFGFLDLVGRQNITALNVNLSAWPVANKVKAAMAFHTFWLTNQEDALYNAGGGAVRRDPLGDSGREVGHELDVTLAWKLCAHSNVLLGYSHFWDSSFIRRTGRSENADLLYVQYGFKF